MSPLIRNCPKCDREISYTHRWCLRRAVKNNAECSSCRGQKRPFEALYNHFMRTAKKQSTLTYSDFLVFAAIGTCHYCDAPINWTRYDAALNSAYNLDRKDNKLGYTKDNCVVCCGSCNRIKGNVLSYLEMMRLGVILREIRLERGTNLPGFGWFRKIQELSAKI